MKTNIQKILCTALTFGMASTAVPMVSAQSLLEEKYQKIESIEHALNGAREKEKSIFGIQAAKASGQQKVVQMEKTIGQIMKEKRDVRLQLSRKRELEELFRMQYGINPQDQEQLENILSMQQEQFIVFARKYARVAYEREQRPKKFGQSVIAKLGGESLGDALQADLAYRAVAASRERLLSLAIEVQGLPEAIAQLTADHQELIDSYHGAATEQDNAKYQIALSNAQLQEIKKIVAEVEAQVQFIQADLARYDERIRMKAERELVARGLKSETTTTVSRKPAFAWPVQGRITANFMEKSYRAFFGVDHKAIDISQPQGSPIRSAADGMVYYVRDGGAYGYSYILIGHRAGYATLYGHVLQANVTKGQEVKQGDIIGLSGGQPGTHGAGPMTTGAHVHFEVILNGVNVNPLSVLP